ncbi:MAG: FG-GAP repeat protein [Saprospiraceae bacterium]|nr:FG-GAP repeat protein [Saprospiraceae bacterium]
MKEQEVYGHINKNRTLRPQNANNFGKSFDIEGSTLVVGAFLGITSNVAKGSAYVYKLNNNIWTQTQKLIAPDGPAK